MGYKKQLASNGFTIVELLIVIVVIGILATITIVAFSGVQERATKALLVSDLNSAAKSLKITQTIEDQYPTDLSTAGIEPSQGALLDYEYDNDASPQTFCVTAYTDNIAYKITQDSEPTEGPCPGSSVASSYITLTNLVSNGDFSDGATGWLTSNAGPVTIVDGAASFTPIGNPTSTTSTHHLYKSVSITTDSVYYIRANVYGKAKIALTTYSYPANTGPSWGSYSARQVATITGTRALGIRSTQTSAWEEIRCDNYLFINLTQTFGAGNEPTQAQMDQIMQQFPNNWFDGTVTANVAGIL